MSLEAHKHRLLREKLWSVLHDGRGLPGHMFNLALILFIILSLAILPFEFLPELKGYRGTLTVLEIITTVFFTVEYVLRIYAAPSRLRYIFSFYGLVDLVSILPFFLGFIGTEYLRAVRLLRILRLLKIGELEAVASTEEAESREKSMGLLPDEKVDYVVTKHPIYLILGCLPPLLATSIAVGVLVAFGGSAVGITIACCLLLFGALFLWKAWLDFSYDVIFVTNKRLILQNQFLLGRSFNQVNYYAITNVIPFYSNTIGYILRFGSIKIETNAATEGHLEIHVVRRHELAARTIMQKCMEYRSAPQQQAQWTGPAPDPGTPA